MKRRLFGKYTFSVGFVVLISLTAMFLILTVVCNNFVSETKHETLKKSCDSVASFIEDSSANADNFSQELGTYHVMKNYMDYSDSNIYVVDNNGVIIICSCDDWENGQSCDHSATQLDMDTVSKIARSDRHTFNDLGIYKELQFVAATEIKGKNSGYVVAATPTTAVKELVVSVTRIYLFAIVIPLLIMLLVLYFITYRLTSSLKLMSEAAKAMAKGDFSKRIPVTGDDELGELAVSFNQMTNSLSRLETMRKNFVADVSHELKTPMTTIAGFIDGIIDGTIEEDKQKYYLGIVHDEIKRLSRMVESMLSLSRLESDEFSSKREQFDFRELLLSVVISQEQRIEQKKLNINGLDGVESVTIEANRDLIYRVVYNLVDNAIKFVNENGNIDFKLEVESKFMTFHIENTGKGIPQAELPMIFDRFYKVDKSRSAIKNSTGLGLYIVKTIVKKHGGNISVASKENEYTRFSVKLPLTK